MGKVRVTAILLSGLSFYCIYREYNIWIIVLLWFMYGMYHLINNDKIQ